MQEKLHSDSDSLSDNNREKQQAFLLKLSDALRHIKEENILPTILVVVDNADMREHISSILSNSFNVLTANNGVDALNKMKETVPTLVLSDIIMPVMDGIGLLKEIKSNKASENIPVIFLTARAGEESIIGEWETDADDYLVKPFLAKELLARVGAQIKLVKLRESLEGKVRNLLMEAPAIICVLQGPQHVFELANEMYLQLIGKRDVLGKTVLEVMPELEGQGYLELLDNVYATGKPYTGNETPAQIDKGNGKLEEAYFNFIYQPTHSSNGKIDGVLLHGIDVTEQVLARKEIEENENQLQNIFLNAPAAIAIFEGPQHKYILANKAYEKLSNRKAADLLGKSMEVLFPELIGTGTLELFDKVLETGESFSAPEYALMLDLRNEGVLRQYYFNFSMESLKNNSGEIYALMATTYDITESVEARKKIEETEKQEAFLLKLSDAIKELIDPVDIQLTACRILGEHVKVNRVLYTEVIDEELVVINNNYVNGVTPIIATLNAEQFGKNVIDAFKRNEKVIFSDINTDSRYTEDEKQSFLALNVVANVGMGLVKGGRWVATFGVHQNVPRNWTDSEILLMEETSERTWAAVERAKAEEALRKSEEKYRTLFTSIDQGFVFCELVRNKEGKGIDYYILEVNPTWEKQSGLSKEMVLGKTILQVFPTIDKGHIDTYAAVVDNQCPVVFEQYFEVNQRWHEVKVYPGEKDKFTVLFSDITERKLSEEKIKESEFRYYEMIYSSPSQMCILKGEDLIIEIANDAILESWGKGKDIIGKSLISVMPEIIEQGFEKLLLSVYKTGEPVYAYETPVTLIRNGKPELLHYTFIYQAQRNVNGEIEGVAIIANEVTPQVELKQQIKESEIRFRTMADASPVLIWTIDAGGLSSYYNKTFRDFIGVSQDEDISDWARIVHPEDVQFAFDTINTAMAERRSYALELRLLRADGQWRWVLAQGNPNIGANNEFLGFVGSSVDFTERKEAEVKIKESEKLLEQKVIERTEQLNEKNIELQKTNKELEAFTYISSHDLQEPLRKIQTFAGRIIATEKEQLSDTAKDYFRRMNDAATRMQTLIQDLLVFSRVNTSERKFEIADLAKIIDEVKEDFREAIEEKNATITTGEMCEANIIPFQVRQLMHNLIGNALKFSRKDIRPVISIESKKVSAANSPLNKPACHIYVSDNGIGFGKEYSEKIFEVFQRLHSKEEYAGTGIGLAIVKKIVDNHNGIITAESGFGEGATFNIYIPV